MTKKEKTTSQPSKEGRLGRRKSKLGNPNAGFVSSIDLAILGAVLALTSSKAGSANAEGVVLPQPERADALPESFGRAVHALSGASAEVMVLAALAENMHRDLARSLRESTFSSPVVVSDSAPFDWSADPTQPRVRKADLPVASPRAEAVVDVTSRAVEPQEPLPDTQVAASRVAPVAIAPEVAKEEVKTTVAERAYGEDLGKMQKAAQDLLGVMRDMFGQEAESVQARQLPNTDSTTDTTRTEVAVEEKIAPVEEVPVADASAGGPPTWLASLGLLGLGGGGGGLVGSLVSAATGVDFSGYAIDGYVSGATVFWDQNGNFIQDANETVQTTTKADGSYSLQGVTKGVGQIVIKGDGIDTNTGGSVGVMAASTSVSDATKAMVTPLTLLMAQGVSESSVKAALGLTTNVSLTDYDPMSVLKAGVGNTQAAGTVLLKAQQLFAVVNAVSGLAASVFGSQADALKATISAISQKDLSTLVGANGGDAAVLSQVIASVVPTYAAAATVAANAIKGVNSVLGEMLANPANALSADARAAALVSQNDLVTQFKSLAELDPAIALTQITAKLANYATADLVKQNFVSVYSETIAAQDRAGGGVITGVDDKTIVLGTNRLIKVSDLLANDVNRGTGSLTLVSVEPKLTWDNLASVSSTPKVSDAEAQVSTVTLGGKLEAGDSVSVSVGTVSKTYVVQVSDVGANDAATAATVTAKLVAELGNVSSTGATLALSGSVITVTGPASGTPVVVTASAQNRSVSAGSTTVADNTQAVAVQTTAGHGDVYKTVYELDLSSASVNSARTTGGYVKLNMGAFTVQVRADVGETTEHLVAKLIDAAKVQAPALKLSSPAVGKIDIESADGSAISDGVNLQAAAKNEALDARLVTLDSVQYVQVDAAAVGQFNLRYVVSNDAGQGVGTVRLTTVPEVQTVGLQAGSAAQINEDTTFVLGDRVDLTGNLSSGVTQSLFVKLSDVGTVAPGTQFTIKVGAEAIRTLTVGESFEVKALPNKTLAETLDLTQVAMPANYHGEFKFQYTLVSSTGSFSTASTAAMDALATSATATGDTPALKLQLGTASAGDVTSDLVVPLVLNPNATQSTRFQLVGGDVAYEQRFVQLSNLPSGMRVLVGNGATTNEVFTDVTDQISLGRLTIQEPVAGQSFGVKFLASSGLIDTNYGLSEDPITVVVYNREPSTGDVAYGAEATFKFDVGGSYGLTVTAQALTVSPEDVAALIGQLDVASVSDGATVKAVIHVPTGMKLGRIANDGVFTELTAGAGVTVVNGTYTLTATSANATTFLDGLGVQPAVNYKGSVTVDATVSAYKGSTDVLLASFDKTMQLTFTPVADGVSGYAPATAALSALEDNAISLHTLFFNGAGTSSPLAALTDSSETLTYVVKSLPAGSRLIDGSSLTGLSGDALRVAIAQANSIGRVVGDGIELTVAEANVANLVVGSNVSLATSNVKLYAYSQEAGSAVVSAYSPVGGATVPVSFTAVADAPYLSMDAQVRGLANVSGLSADLQAKTKIEIPASVALTDTDGSESLWVRITPVNAGGTVIATTGFDFTGIASATNYSWTSSSYLVKASELSSLRVASTTAFSGTFKVDAISVEGAPTTAAAARTIIDAGASNAVAVTSQNLAVQFLQPATTPVVTFGGLPPSLTTVTKTGGTEYDLTFKVNVTSGASDKVTVLMTGVPATATDKAKFYIVDGSTEKLIGAPAEVSGVWVFNASELRDASGPVTVHMVLPSGYTNTNTVFDVTAFAVDSLGLTNAKSSTLTSAPLSLSVPSEALDPVIIDTAGDGLALTNAATRVAFDLNADGNPDQVGWVSGKDDAFLVLRKDANKDGVFEDTVTNGSSLATENLVSPVTTDAIADLRTFDDNQDGILTKAELANHGLTPQLWFDNAAAAATANGVAAASELANVSDNFSINLAAYNDTATRDAGGALLAGSIASGGITGTYTLPSGAAQSLSTARTFDVFLPVTTTTATAQSTLAAFAKTEIEDAPNGIDLSAALVGADWQSQFGTAWTNGIEQGANVLLTVRAKEAGTTFNLSQGARLDGQATDTWLLLWKPLEASSLKLFAKDNFSGLMDLEMRATVVYTSGLTPVSYTVSRDLGLTVTPVSDRPDLVVPDTFAAVNETALAAGQDIELTGLKLAARDGSETVSLVFAPTTALPSGSYFKYKGATITPDVNGKFTITGQVSASDVQLHVPAYASGTFGFNVTAVSRDGTAAASQIDNIPLTVRVTPVAQAPVVTLTAAQASVSESVREFAVTLQATPVDPDGSEEIASVKLLVSNANLTAGSTFVVGAGAAAVTYAFASTAIAGQFELVLPKSALTAGAGLAKTLTGKIVTPAYFDGSLNIQAAATTLEKADATLQATGNSGATTVTITPVTDGLAAFDTKGLLVNAGEEIAFSKLITSLTKLDADESLTLTVSGIPAGATLYESGVSYALVGGVATITNASLAKLANFKLVTGTLQTDFALTVTASSKDDAATAVDVVKSINISSVPLLEPVIVKSNGTALVDGKLGLSFNEGTSGILDVGVTVGSKLNPVTATVTLSGVPTGIKVYAVATNTELSAVALDATTNKFVLNATALSQGLRLVVPSTADASLVDFSGKVNLSLSTSVVYGGVTKTTVTPTTLLIQPVTDGLSFTTSIARAEDQSWSVSDLLGKKDSSETLSSVTIAQNANLTVWVNGVQLTPANGAWKLSGTDIANAVLKPVANYHGPLSLGLTTVTQDFGTADTTVAAALTQNTSVAVNLSAVADTPVVVGDAESQVQLFASNVRTSLLTDAVINDGRVDTGANLNLAIRLAAVTSPDAQETLTTVLTGSAIGSGVALQFTTTAGVLQSLTSSFVGGKWQISVPSSYTAVALDATLVIPKAAGYGARELTVTAQTVDGTSVNTTVVDTDTFTILSTIPPQPVVGVLPEVKGADLSLANTLGLKLTDLVRVPLLNESVVLELIGLTPGVQVKVGSTVLNAVSPALSTVDGAALTAIRITAAQLETARVVLPADVVNGTTALSFSARSGSSDGYVVDPATGAVTSEVRYVYSHLVDTNVHLSVATAGDDHVVVQAELVDVGAGDGDDTVVVDGKGAGALTGGDGTDTLSLAGLQDGAMVDLNLGKMIALSADNAVQTTSSAVRSVSGFEVLVGSAASDTLVSNGDATTAMTLRGRGGDDILVGGAGNDLIEGGSGSDELTGGAGVDTFVLAKGSGHDTVIDFNLSQDKIVLAGFGLNFGVGNSLPASVHLAASTDGDWVVKVDDASSGTSGAQLLLKGSASASQADIIARLSFDDTHDWVNGDVHASDFQMPVDAQALAVSGLARELFLGDNYDFSDLDSMMSVIADARFEKALAVNLNTHLGTVNDLGDMAGYKGFAGTAHDDVLVGNDQSSVLLGGAGGSDVLVGGAARDILVAGGKTLAEGMHITDELTGGGGADMFVFVKSASNYDSPGSSDVNQTLHKIYEVNVTDFNREEGDRIVAVGYGDSVDSIKIDNVDSIGNTQAVHFSDSLTVYFDLSFAREFDSNFSLRMADFDKI